MVKRISRKGFTLVELLAVIVVLGLLIAIVSGPILGTLTKSKNSLNSTQVKMIELAAKNMGLENLDKLPSASNKTSKCITVGELVEEGFLDEVPKNLKTDQKIDVNSGVVISCNGNCKKLTYKYVESCNDVQSFFGDGILVGDIDADGDIDKDDTIVFAMYLNDGAPIYLENTDIDGDGTIKIVDQTMLVNYVLGNCSDITQCSTTVGKGLGDVNGDAILEHNDLTRLAQFVANWETSIIGVVAFDNADINENNIVDKDDLDALASYFSRKCESIDDCVRDDTGYKSILGDVNNDGILNRNDLTRLSQYVSGWNVEINDSNANISKPTLGDNNVDKIDLNALSRYFARWDCGENMQACVENNVEDDILGDINGDLFIDELDSRLLSRYINTQDVDIKNADVNKDGTINISDQTMLVNYLLGNCDIISSCPIDKVLTGPVEEKKEVIGDVNGDGKLDRKDLTNISQFAVNFDSSKLFVFKNADINGDKKINEKDLQIFSNYFARRCGNDITKCS